MKEELEFEDVKTKKRKELSASVREQLGDELGAFDPDSFTKKQARSLRKIIQIATLELYPKKQKEKKEVAKKKITKK